MNNNITNEKQYRGYGINNGHKKDFTCYTKTLDQIVDIVEYLTTHHSKSLFVRLDVRNSMECLRNLSRKDITRSIENVKRSIDRRYKGPNRPDIKVVWTTENEDTNPHFHMFFGVNGNAIQNGYRLLHEVNEEIKKRTGSENDGLVEFCKSNGKMGIMVNRNSENLHEEIEKAVYAASYLAKTRSKEDRQKGARVSSASRLPRDWKDNTKYKEIFESSQICAESGNIDISSTSEIYKDSDYTCMHPPLEEYITFDD